MAAAEESIRGKTRPDMSRNEGLAGQTVTKGDYEYTYDDNGYAKRPSMSKTDRNGNRRGMVEADIPEAETLPIMTLSSPRTFPDT